MKKTLKNLTIPFITLFLLSNSVLANDDEQVFSVKLFLMILKKQVRKKISQHLKKQLMNKMMKMKTVSLKGIILVMM